VVAFIEQVQKIEKSKASIVEVVSCLATVKARIQERQSDVHYTDTNQNEREAFLVELVFSLKLVCNLKHLSCKQFHKTVKGDSTFLGNLRNLQNIHELNRTSK